MKLINWIGVVGFVAMAAIVGVESHKNVNAARQDLTAAIANGDYLASGQVAVTGPTAVIPGSIKNLCVDLTNMSQTARVFIGSTTSISTTNGYPLSVSSGTTPSVSFGAISGPIYVVAETGPTTVAWETCTNQ